MELSYGGGSHDVVVDMRNDFSVHLCGQYGPQDWDDGKGWYYRSRSGASGKGRVQYKPYLLNVLSTRFCDGVQPVEKWTWHIEAQCFILAVHDRNKVECFFIAYKGDEDLYHVVVIKPDDLKFWLQTVKMITLKMREDTESENNDNDHFLKFKTKNIPQWSFDSVQSRFVTHQLRFSMSVHTHAVDYKDIMKLIIAALTPSGRGFAPIEHFDTADTSQELAQSVLGQLGNVVMSKDGVYFLCTRDNVYTLSTSDLTKITKADPCVGIESADENVVLESITPYVHWLDYFKFVKSHQGGCRVYDLRDNSVNCYSYIDADLTDANLTTDKPNKPTGHAISSVVHSISSIVYQK